MGSAQSSVCDATCLRGKIGMPVSASYDKYEADVQTRDITVSLTFGVPKSTNIRDAIAYFGSRAFREDAGRALECPSIDKILGRYDLGHLDVPRSLKWGLNSGDKVDVKELSKRRVKTTFVLRMSQLVVYANAVAVIAATADWFRDSGCFPVVHPFKSVASCALRLVAIGFAKPDFVLKPTRRRTPYKL